MLGQKVRIKEMSYKTFVISGIIERLTVHKMQKQQLVETALFRCKTT